MAENERAIEKEETTSESPETGTESPNPREAEVAELKDKLLRALAENDNVRKRFQKEKEDALKFGVVNLARDIVEIADNLKRALENKTENASVDALLLGIDLIAKDLDNIFKRHDIEKIAAEGAVFDPHSHQAVFEVESEESQPGTIVQVVQDGYKIHDRLLRPAMVGVAKAKAT